MAFVNILFLSDFLHFDKSLLLLTVTLRGVSNKHCLLSLFSFKQLRLYRLKSGVIARSVTMSLGNQEAP